jgi:hypothetical protein
MKNEFRRFFMVINYDGKNQGFTRLSDTNKTINWLNIYIYELYQSNSNSWRVHGLPKYKYIWIQASVFRNTWVLLSLMTVTVVKHPSELSDLHIGGSHFLVWQDKKKNWPVGTDVKHRSPLNSYLCIEPVLARPLNA